MSINPKVFKQVRKALGLTQQELADRLGISRVTVNKMEQGRLKRGIPDDVGAKLLELKQADFDKLPKGVTGIPVYKAETTSTTWPASDKHLWDNAEDEA